MVPAIAVLLLALGLQSPPDERARAEALARAGRTAESRVIFQEIVRKNPGDVEARLWMARLDLRAGKTAEAEAGFRAVLREHPADIDAQIGLGMTLTRMGEADEALAVLRDAEPTAGPNADLLAALARAYRRTGNDERALAYFVRAHALAPDDPDIAAGLEAVARAYGHWVGAEGLLQLGPSATDVGSVTVFGSRRIRPTVHVQGNVRTQHGPDYVDTTAGAGVQWRAVPSTTLTFRFTGGSHNVALSNRDVAADVVHYLGPFEIAGEVRQLSFSTSDVLALSPIGAWTPDDRLRLDARYTYSRASFHDVGGASGDHSGLLRGTWQARRRLAMLGGYAYGIESFEDLTADRVSSLGASTLSAGIRVDTPSLTRFSATWEWQFRSNHSRIDRVTIAVVQSFR